MTSSGSERGNKDRTEPLDAWEATFNSDDPDTTVFMQDDEVGPTRVLTPPDSAPTNGSISATRPRRGYHDDPTETYSTEDFREPQLTETPRQTRSLTQQQPAQQTQPYSAVPDRNYARVQFLPGLLGWLATCTLWVFFTQVFAVASYVFGIPHFNTFGEGFAEALATSSAGNPAGIWTCLGIFAGLIFFSFALGGYAATRMAGISPAKQAVGVWLWFIFAILLSTLTAFVLDTSSNGIELGLSGQALLGDEPLDKLPGVLIMLFLALLGSLFGSMFGLRYHKKFLGVSKV